MIGRERDTVDMFNRNSDRGRFGDNDSAATAVRTGNPSIRSNLTDIDLVIHHGTDRAILVSIDGNERRAVWLPKSLITINHLSQRVIGQTVRGRQIELNTATITLSTKMAKEKGLV